MWVEEVFKTRLGTTGGSLAGSVHGCPCRACAPFTFQLSAGGMF